jgi:hypothetical protein
MTMNRCGLGKGGLTPKTGFWKMVVLLPPKTGVEKYQLKPPKTEVEKKQVFFLLHWVLKFMKQESL